MFILSFVNKTYIRNGRTSVTGWMGLFRLHLSVITWGNQCVRLLYSKYFSFQCFEFKSGGGKLCFPHPPLRINGLSTSPVLRLILSFIYSFFLSVPLFILLEEIGYGHIWRGIDTNQV